MIVTVRDASGADQAYTLRDGSFGQPSKRLRKNSSATFPLRALDWALLARIAREAPGRAPIADPKLSIIAVSQGDKGLEIRAHMGNARRQSAIVVHDATGAVTSVR